MNTFHNKNLHNIYLQKKYYGHIFLMPPDHYAEALKKLYWKIKSSGGPKTLNELKKFALEEVKKVSIGMKSKKQRGDSELTKDEVLKILKAVHDIINPLIVKINQNFKNERRQNYENNEKYMEIIRKFEQHKINLINFTIRSICKTMKIRYSILQSTILNLIQKGDKEVITCVNNFSTIGGSFALAPKNLTNEDILDILKKYYNYMVYMINNNKKSEVVKYLLIVINDIIYEDYGLEEEQIFAYIQEHNLMSKIEISNYVNLIKKTITDNINLLFDI